jgi:hypothetical protein
MSELSDIYHKLEEKNKKHSLAEEKNALTNIIPPAERLPVSVLICFLTRALLLT